MQHSSPSSQARALAHPERIPDLDEVSGRYRLRFARSARDLDEIQRLRFDVFHLELGEGLAANQASGRDRDQFDAQCQHLMVMDLATEACVGTYRMQIPAAAREGHGFYSAGEFQLDDLPAEFLEQSIELGRACIARAYRDHRVLFLLWRGLSAYADHVGLKGMFGCSSLTSQDPAEGLCFHQLMIEEGHLHPQHFARPRKEFLCHASPEDLVKHPKPVVPTLFQIYLRYGAKVIGGPALDREFGTIDSLIHLHINEEQHGKFSSPKGGHSA